MASPGPRTPFTKVVVRIIRGIPRGKVASYGQVAALAGSAAAVRQVVRVLHCLSEREHLPWHRVASSRGTILLPGFEGELQRSLLEREGVAFGIGGVIDFEHWRWAAPRHPRGLEPVGLQPARKSPRG